MKLFYNGSTLKALLLFFCLFSDRCSGNLNILFEDLTLVDGLKQKSCKNSENLSELLVFKVS